MVIPIGIKSDVDWAEAGTPSWGSIRKIRIAIATPSADVGRSCRMQIDGMQMLSWCYGYYGDIVSQTTYGRIDGIGYPSRSNLISDAECTFAASLIVDAYKDPLVNISNLEVTDNFGLTLGTEYVFNTLDVNNTLNVRKVTHTVDNLNLTTQIDLSERYRPSTDVLLATFQRGLDILGRDLELWKKITTAKSTGAGDGKGLTDWWDVDPAIGGYIWGNSNNYLISGGENSTVGLIEGIDGPGEPMGETFDCSIGRIRLSSGTNNSYTAMVVRNGPSWMDPNDEVLDCSNTIILGTNFEISSTYAVSARIAAGLDGGPWVTAKYFGIYIGNNLLYGWADNGIGGMSVNLYTTITPNTRYNAQAIFYPAEKVEFWVDRIYKGAITNTSYLPTDYMGLCSFRIKTYENSGKTISLRNIQIGEVV
jgi:hypothetical protein